MSQTLNGTGLSQAPGTLDRRTIPFDYTFEFALTGRPGNVVRDTHAVSIEGSFWAVSIGYGLIPRVTTIAFGPNQQELRTLKGQLEQAATAIAGPGVSIAFFSATTTPRRQFTVRDLPMDFILRSLSKRQNALSAKLQDLPFLRTEAGVEAILQHGIRLNPVFLEQALGGGIEDLPDSLLGQLFQTVAAPPEDVQFRYAIFDDGTGRSFQSDPILSTAGLGIADGDRPFRHFTPPIVFGPRATVRIEVTEISEFAGDLSIVLHGFKRLGDAGTPTSARRIQRRR